MRRQFLRVYLGIALVLVAAAVAILFVVEREVRSVVDQRIVEMVDPWVKGFRRRLKRHARDPEGRSRLLERLNDNAPFPIRIVPLDSLGLAADRRRRLLGAETVLVRTDQGRMVYALLGDDEVLAAGPLRGRMFGPLRGPRARRGPGGVFGRPGRLPDRALGRPPGGPGFFSPVQGTYFLLGALLFILVVIGAAVYLLLRPFERRINALSSVARAFGEGQLDSRAPVDRQDAIGELARTFNHMAERIGQAIEGQRELLRAVSHEFRTPLARLFFLVEDAQEAEAPQERGRILTDIEASLQDLNDLVEELLAFVRLEGDAELSARQTFDARDVLADLEGAVPARHEEVRLDVDCGPVPVLAVPRLFKRAVRNLVTNAVRHARARVEVSCRRQGDTVILGVDDDGPGVPPESRRKIFEPFLRLDESRAADSGGVGLGLAIVRRIMEVHGGRVEVGESPLGGARFSLYFPVSRSRPPGTSPGVGPGSRPKESGHPDRE